MLLSEVFLVNESLIQFTFNALLFASTVYCGDGAVNIQQFSQRLYGVNYIQYMMHRENRMRCGGSPGGVRGRGGSSSRAQEDIGLLDKTVKVGFFQL